MRLLKRILPIIIGLACSGWVWERTQAPREPRTGIRVTLTVTSPMSDVFELFYDSIGQGFAGQWSTRSEMHPATAPQEIVLDLPSMDTLHGLRIDPGDHRTTIILHGIRIEGPYRSLIWNADDILAHFSVTHDMDTLRADPERRGVVLHCTGTDPYLVAETGTAAGMQPVLSKVRPVLYPFVIAALVGCLGGLLVTMLLRIRIRRLRSPELSLRWSIPALLLMALSAGTIFFLTRALLDGIRIKEHKNSIHVVGSFPHDDDTQIFLADQSGGFTKNALVPRSVTGSQRPQLLHYALPSDRDVHYLRFDPGMQQDTLWLDSMSIVVDDLHRTWPAIELKDRLVPNEHVASMETVDGRLRIITRGNDPFFMMEEDLGPTVKGLTDRSGNGPLPTVIATIAALFFLFSAGPAIARSTTDRSASISDLLIVAFFALIIASPILISTTGREPQLENTEKRVLARKPPYTLARTLSYPDEFTTYYAENFGLRQVYFRWNSVFISKVLRTSPLPDRALFGKDGWLFYMQPGAMQKYEGICDIPDEQLHWVADRLERRRLWLEAQGIQYILMIPPEKSVIYADKLPDRIEQFGEPSCLDRLLKRLNERSGLKVVDIRGVLKDARQMRDVYYTTDTHWNPVGAWFGYAALMNAMRDHDPSITPPVPYGDHTIHLDTNDQGDIAQLMGLNDVFTRVTPLLLVEDTLRAKDAPSGSYANSGFMKYPPITKEIPNSKAPRLLVFRDSFAVYMIPSLSEHFSRSTFVWTPVFIPAIVAEERPDIVVHEVMELFLSDLLQDDLPLPPLSTPFGTP